MIMVETLTVGLTTLSKAAMSKGMSPFVFVVYCNALATLIFLPFLFFQRKKRPPLSFSLICKFFLLSLVGLAVMQNCTIVGVNYSSPTLASAILSVVPAITFMLAVFFRKEKLDLSNSKGQIKVMGALVSISGALIITIYKGPPILVPQSQSTQNPYLLRLMAASNWIIGGLFLLGADISLAIWNIAQGIFANVVTYSLLTWCIDKKGPVFVVMFKPLGIAIAAFASTIVLGDTLYIGSAIGAFPIVIGFYGVIWAQSEEKKVENHCVVDELYSPSSLSSPLTPLLESHNHV